MKSQIIQLFKNSYMCVISCLSRLYRSKVSGKVTYVLGFPENNYDLLQKLRQSTYVEDVLILYTAGTKKEAYLLQESGFQAIAINSPLFFLKGLRHLVTSKVVIVDNYFAFLGGVSFSDETKIYQIWHAAGAIKKFGWEDEKTESRTKKDQRRFQQVYDVVDYYVTGSQEMSRVFQHSYHQPSTKMLEIGVPRTDYYFDLAQKTMNKERFYQKFPEAMHKKVVLYAPTYREQSEADEKWSEKFPELPSDYFVLAKLHPHTLNRLTGNLSEVSIETDMRGLNLRELLSVVEILVTDYSSIPFEYELANSMGKTFYYCYDLTQYRKNVGIQDNFFEENQIDIIHTKEDLREKLTADKVMRHKLTTWNQFNDGKATQRLLAHIEQEMKK